MTEPLFLADLDRPEVGRRFVLDGDEGRHAVAVRRIRPGEIIKVADGAGRAVRGPVIEVGRQGLTLEIAEVINEPESAVRWVAVQALAKGDRAELAVEMLTELGVSEIVPWQSSRSVVKWAADRVERGLTRWRATAREAAKQSRRLRVPTVSAPLTTTELTLRIREAALAVILHESASLALSHLAIPAAGEIILVIGPEGGLSDEEVTGFADAGGVPVLVAGSVLRTSTAGVVGLAQLQALSARDAG